MWPGCHNRGVVKRSRLTSTRGRREAYLLRARKLDMEMPPDTLEAVGVNELLVAVTLDESFTTEHQGLLQQNIRLGV